MEEERTSAISDPAAKKHAGNTQTAMNNVIQYHPPLHCSTDIHNIQNLIIPVVLTSTDIRISNFDNYVFPYRLCIVTLV